MCSVGPETKLMLIKTLILYEKKTETSSFGALGMVGPHQWGFSFFFTLLQDHGTAAITIDTRGELEAPWQTGPRVNVASSLVPLDLFYETRQQRKEE